MNGTNVILADLLLECEVRAIRLIPTGDERLTIDAPKDKLTPQLLDRLRERKAEILEFLERFEERAAIMEFDGGLPRADAEKLAWKQCCPN